VRFLPANNVILISSFVLYLAAFRVSEDDSRVVLREISHSPSLVLSVSYSLVMKMTDYYLFVANSNSQLSGSLLNNITDAITDGHRRWLSARDGSVFSVPFEFQTRPSQDLSEITIEGSALIIALNATEPSDASWTAYTSSAFHHSTDSPAIHSLNILSPETFQARLCCPNFSCIMCALSDPHIVFV
jgi:hypothetical protein